MVSEYFQHEITRSIGAIRFNRPEKLNAINYEMWVEFKKLVDGFQKNKDVKALFLFSTNPKCFSTGADMDEFERKSGDKKWRAANFKAIRGAMDALMKFPKPTVAGISGMCLGGGLGVATACDIRYADLSAKFSLPPAKIGLVYPYPEVKRLVDLIGRSQAAELLYTSRTIDAKTARAMGLVTKIFPFDDFEKHLNLLAGQLSVYQSSSLMGLKHMLLQVDSGQSKDTKATEELFLKAYDSEHFNNTMKMMRQKSNKIKGIQTVDKGDTKTSTRIQTKIKPKNKAGQTVKPKAAPNTKTAQIKAKPASTKTAKPAPKKAAKKPAPKKAAKKPTPKKAAKKPAPKPKAKAPAKKTTKPKAKAPAKKVAKKKAAKPKAKAKGKKS